MKFKLLILIAAILLLSGCSHVGGYSYNQKIAKLYFQVSEPFEEIYNNFEEGNRIPSNSDLTKSIDALKETMNETMVGYNEITPLEEAKEFHSKVGQYFDMVEKDFVKEIQTYIDLDCKCETKRDSIVNRISILYSKITDIENEMQNEQTKFADKIGMKIND